MRVNAIQEVLCIHFVNAKGILSAQNGINIYRGCTHGCIYCDSRSACYQIKHAFDDIEVKQNAAELLDAALARKRRRCMISTGSMCDPYMHCESELGLMRRCLEVIYRRGFGADILTKSDLVLRDLDLMESINRRARCVVQLTLTTYNEALCRIIEPNVCTTRRRYEALKELHACGIPTVVWLSPILPFINDTEENLRGILDYCFDAGVSGIVCFGMGMTLRDGNREYFYSALDRHFPGMRLRYAREYGLAHEIASENNARLMEIFHSECSKHKIIHFVAENFDFMREFSKFSGIQIQMEL